MTVSNEIRICGIALGNLIPQVTEEQAALLRMIKRNLIAAADSAMDLEAMLVPNQITQPVETC